MTKCSFYEIVLFCNLWTKNFSEKKMQIPEASLILPEATLISIEASLILP